MPDDIYDIHDDLGRKKGELDGNSGVIRNSKGHITGHIKGGVERTDKIDIRNRKGEHIATAERRLSDFEKGERFGQKVVVGIFGIGLFLAFVDWVSTLAARGVVGVVRATIKNPKVMIPIILLIFLSLVAWSAMYLMRYFGIEV